MKSNKRNFFIYFVLVAPILMKGIEWLYQGLGFGNFDFLMSIWVFQIIFILTLSFIVYFFSFWILNRERTIFNYSINLGIVYFLKEIYNLFFVSHSFSQGSLISLTLEPIFMFVIVGLLFSKFLFNKEIFK